MENSTKPIRRPDSPQDGPSDGVMMVSDCIRTDFIENPKEGEALFTQQEKTESRIAASLQLGTFSIRDRQTGVMLTISIADAARVIDAAVQASKEKE